MGISSGLNPQSDATPIDPEEAAELIPSHIATIDQLNQWEAADILNATEWALRRKQSNVPSEGFVRRLHQRMFHQTWKWAGHYRATEKDLGSPPSLISTHVRDACGNAAYWLQHKVFPPTELAVRFHHRMVVVHPFPNGNGRHARLLADVVLASLDEPELTWGRTNLQQAGTAREDYIRALKLADKGDFQSLIELARA
ncbi:MAG: mobile mystery protein B [Gemmatimonadaceae bacterium]|nr:mobile mystery protein B [Gemmatimonadaceae bacterium]